MKHNTHSFFYLFAFNVLLACTVLVMLEIGLVLIEDASLFIPSYAGNYPLLTLFILAIIIIPLSILVAGIERAVIKQHKEREWRLVFGSILFAICVVAVLLPANAEGFKQFFSNEGSLYYTIPWALYFVIIYLRFSRQIGRV